MVESNTSRIKAYLDTLADEIRALDAKIPRLAQFLKIISEEQHAAAFSDEERAAVEAQLLELRTRRETKAHLLEEKLSIYETRVVGLQERIETRRSVMETCEQHVGDFDDIMELFVRTHADLTRELDDAHSEIGETFPLEMSK